MSVPPVEWVWASVPKAGNLPEENEDAVATDAARLRFAVADGATEGWQSGAWAAHLAAAFVRRPSGPADFPDWLAAARRDWVPPAPSAFHPRNGAPRGRSFSVRVER